MTEMWERFSFYGMRALLVLFMAAPQDKGGLGLDPLTAAGVYSIYNAMVYMMSMPGGWVADRLWGARRAVLIGGIVIAAGHFVMAVPVTWFFWLGLLLIVLGTGLLKPNMSTMVGDLYGEHDTRRDAGFSLFYLGINLGAFLAPIVCGYLGENIDWHLGFGAAGVGMTIGLIQYVLGRRHIAGLGELPKQPATAAERTRTFRNAAIWLGAAVVVFGVDALLGNLRLSHVINILTVLAIAVPVAYFAMIYKARGLTGVERSRMSAFVWIFLAATLFWMIYDQAGGLLNLFVNDKVDRTILGWEMPTSWFQSIPALFVVLLAPVFAALWLRMGERQPHTAVKFALGLIAIGASFAVMAAAARAASGGALISPLWLAAVFLVQTVAELLLSPVGLSASTKLAPHRFVGQVMGLWFLATATGNALAAQVTKLHAAVPDALYYALLGAAAVLAGIAFLSFRRRMAELMAGVDLHRRVACGRHGGWPRLHLPRIAVS